MARDSTESRERILQACERCIAQSGLRGFRMQDVAREAGVSIGLLSYHFGDRESLLQAALDHVNASAADRAGRIPNASSAAERLSALLKSEFGSEPQIRAGSIAWNELRAAAVFEPAGAAALKHSTAEWQNSVRSLIAESQPQLDAEMAALTLTALVEGLSGRWLTGQITEKQAQNAVEASLFHLGISASRPESRI